MMRFLAQQRPLQPNKRSPQKFSSLIALGAQVALAAVLVLAATVLTDLLEPVARYTPFAFYYAAVFAAALYGGVGAGVLTVLVSALKVT